MVRSVGVRVMRLESSGPAGMAYRVIWELKPIILSRISRLNPSTMAMAASMTATDRATAVTATRIAGEFPFPAGARDNLFANNRG